MFRIQEESMDDEEEKREQGIDLTEIVTSPTAASGVDEEEIREQEQSFAEDVHEAIASSLASEAPDSDELPLSVEHSDDTGDKTRGIAREYLIAGAIVGSMLVVMISLLVMGYFVGYYDGDANESEQNDKWPDIANGTLTGL